MVVEWHHSGGFTPILDPYRILYLKSVLYSAARCIAGIGLVPAVTDQAFLTDHGLDADIPQATSKSERNHYK